MKLLKPSTQYKKDYKCYRNRPEKVSDLIRFGLRSDLFK